jgi:hypothetical protein
MRDYVTALRTLSPSLQPDGWEAEIHIFMFCKILCRHISRVLYHLEKDLFSLTTVGKTINVSKINTQQAERHACLQQSSMLVFWVVTSYRLVSRYQRFGGTYCLHLQYCLHFQPWRWRQNVPTKRWYLSISPYDVTTQETSSRCWDPINIDVRTPKLVTHTDIAYIMEAEKQEV